MFAGCQDTFSFQVSLLSLRCYVNLDIKKKRTLEQCVSAQQRGRAPLFVATRTLSFRVRNVRSLRTCTVFSLTPWGICLAHVEVSSDVTHPREGGSSVRACDCFHGFRYRGRHKSYRAIDCSCQNKELPGVNVAGLCSALNVNSCSLVSEEAISRHKPRSVGHRIAPRLSWSSTKCFRSE